MKISENVFQIAESFMKESRHVKLNNENIKKISKVISESDKPRFPISDKDIEVFPAIVRELVASSINYCYWYGRDTVRPNGANSTKMYNLLETSFEGFASYSKSYEFYECLDALGKALSKERFPLIEDRIRHLNELKKHGLQFCNEIHTRYHAGIDTGVSLDSLLEDMIVNFPGFASDIFLKRASLFFIQLYRRFGWLEDELHTLHIPADYQVPKMLESFMCFEYSDELQDKIMSNQQIPKNSLEECEIRAATILTAKKMCELTGWNVSDIDSFFFLARHSATKPFHLTITTDY